MFYIACIHDCTLVEIHCTNREYNQTAFTVLLSNNNLDFCPYRPAIAFIKSRVGSLTVLVTTLINFLLIQYMRRRKRRHGTM